MAIKAKAFWKRNILSLRSEENFDDLIPESVLTTSRKISSRYITFQRKWDKRATIYIENQKYNGNLFRWYSSTTEWNYTKIEIPFKPKLKAEAWLKHR